MYFDKALQLYQKGNFKKSLLHAKREHLQGAPRDCALERGPDEGPLEAPRRPVLAHLLALMVERYGQYTYIYIYKMYTARIYIV